MMTIGNNLTLLKSTSSNAYIQKLKFLFSIIFDDFPFAHNSVITYVLKMFTYCMYTLRVMRQQLLLSYYHIKVETLSTFFFELLSNIIQIMLQVASILFTFLQTVFRDKLISFYLEIDKWSVAANFLLRRKYTQQKRCFSTRM